MFLRLDRLGEGAESARSAVATAKAVVEEVGAQNVHRVTKRVASLKPGNEHRDLFKFVRLPVDISWVTCPVFEKPGSDKIVDGRLPMLDPHELLQYLWTTGRLRVDSSTIKILSCIYEVFTPQSINFLFFYFSVFYQQDWVCKALLVTLEQSSILGSQP